MPSNYKIVANLQSVTGKVSNSALCSVKLRNEILQTFLLKETDNFDSRPDKVILSRECVIPAGVWSASFAELGVEKLWSNRKIRTPSRTVVPKTTPTGMGLSSVATIRRRPTAWTSCRKQAAAIMRDEVIGCDRFSRSRENGVLIIPARRQQTEGSSVIRFEAAVASNLPLSLQLTLRLFYTHFSLLFSSFSQPTSLLVKIQFVPAHCMENKRTGH